MHILQAIYVKLYQAFGPQHWWPGDSPFEVAVGAILTQNTNWGNVEKAIRNLKTSGALSAKALHAIPDGKLAGMIRPAGYFNIKAERLKSFVGWLMHHYGGNMQNMGKEDVTELRKKLLSVRGIGPETADSILLYATGKPVFVIDAYTKRMLSRHGIMEHDKPYDRFQEMFHDALARDAGLFNEYHALIVKAGKTFCRRNNPLCAQCPLEVIQEDRITFRENVPHQAKKFRQMETLQKRQQDFDTQIQRYA